MAAKRPRSRSRAIATADNTVQTPPTDQELQVPEMPAPPPDDTEYLEEISKDFRRLQRQKSRTTGGVEARILLARCFKWGEQYVTQTAEGMVAEVQKANKLYLVFNLIQPRINKWLGRVSAMGGDYKATADNKDPKAIAEAEVVTNLIKGLDQKLRQPTKTWELLETLATDGVAFEYTPWVENATMEPVVKKSETGEILLRSTIDGQEWTESQVNQFVQRGMPRETFEVIEEMALTGDVGSEVLSALNVFIDQSVKSVEDLAPDQAVYVAKIKTLGWVKDKYGDKAATVTGDKELKIVTTSILQNGLATASMYLKDLIPAIQGYQDEDDAPLCLVVERYQPVSKDRPHGRFTCFIPHKHILFDGECPYDEIPLTDFHTQPVTSTFWTKDLVTDLVAPQRFVNKRLSQAGEYYNLAVYAKLLCGGTLTDKDFTADESRVVPNGISETGQPLAHYLEPPALAQGFLEVMDQVIKLFNDIAGGADLLEEHKFPGQLRGPMAVPLLQEIMDSQWGPFFSHFGERMARVKQQRLNRVKKFYPPVRTLHYVDKDQRDEVLEFHKDILTGPVNYNVTVERGSILPELRMMREARIIERLTGPLAILYTDERTGRIDKSKVAEDLQEGDVGREARESHARKFIRQLIDRMKQGQPVPPPMPFWDAAPMMDELEAVMLTTEFYSFSGPIQQAFEQMWNAFAKILNDKAMAQQQAMQSQMVHSAVAQATQQAAATAAAESVKAAMGQLQAQALTQPSVQQLVQSAVEKAGLGRPKTPPLVGSAPPQKGPTNAPA